MLQWPFGLARLRPSKRGPDRPPHTIKPIVRLTGESFRRLVEPPAVGQSVRGRISREPGRCLPTCWEDRGAAVASGIRRVQSGADFDDDARAQGKVSVELLGKR